MVLIITAAVQPGENIKNLKERSVKSRLEQYYAALEQTILSGAFSRIVFCDNTEVELSAFQTLTKLAGEHGVELELLSFAGDAQAVARQGKGYGEGEIMEYVMYHSRLVKEADFLVKLTGRLVVDKLRQTVRKMKTDRCYFNIPNRTRREMVDTRFYAMPIKLFQDFFQKEYVRVDDKKGYYLEYVYTDTIKKNGLRTYNMPLYPRITGLSGSTGAVYTYREWKCRIKDVLSRLQWYKLKPGKDRRGEKNE